MSRSDSEESDISEDEAEVSDPIVSEIVPEIVAEDLKNCLGKVIHCSEYDKYPKRENFYTDKIDFEDCITVMPISVDDKKTTEEIRVVVAYKRAKMMLHITGTKLRYFLIAGLDKQTEIATTLKIQSVGKYNDSTYELIYHESGYRRLMNYGPEVPCFEVLCDDVYFRFKSIKQFRSMEYEVAGDDIYPIRKLSGEYNLYFSKPMKLKKFAVSYDDRRNYYLIKAHYSDIEIDENANCEYLVMTNDIETIVDKSKSNALFPAVMEEHAHMFLFSATFHFGNSRSACLRVSITDIDIVSPDCMIIKCNTYAEIVRSIGWLMQCMKPDYVLGFNCSDYDWPFIVQRARNYGIVEEFAKNLSFVGKYEASSFEKDNHIKMTADTFIERKKMTVFGMVFIDLRVYLMRLYPATKGEKSSSSLKTYLKKLRLDGKEDMDISEMFQIYRDYKAGKPSRRLVDIVKYCVVDAERCNDLNVASNCIVDVLTTAKISYATTDDWNTMANGAKVKNILSAKASELKLLMTHHKKIETVSDSTYEGAYVFDPVKGTTPDPIELSQIRQRVSQKSDCMDLLDKIGRPVTGLDFSSLYPNIIINYNISPDTFDGAGLSEDVHTIAISDTMTGRFVKESTLTGIYPIILSRYFALRKMLKKTLAEVNAKIETGDGDKEQLYKMKVIADANQNAVKVIMNTFYGEAGNQKSPFYLRELASSVTAMGRYHIKRAASLVEDIGCKIWYGDTDSIYISSARKTFLGIDDDLNSGIITVDQWLTKNVELSKVENERIRQIINEDIFSITGKRVLAMEREEELYPCLFAGKKKYCGIKHVDRVDFNITDYNLFARGLDFIKGSSTELIRETMSTVVKKAMSIYNEHHIYSIVVDTLRRTNVTDRSTVKKKCILKPNKNNRPLINLKKKIENRQKRLAESGIPFKEYTIELNVNFDTVVVKPNINIFAKADDSVSSRTELYEYAEENNLELDTVYYLNTTIKSCARLCHTMVNGYLGMDDDTVNKAAIALIKSDLKSTLGTIDATLKREVLSSIKKKSVEYLPTMYCIDWLIELASTPADKSYRTTLIELCAKYKKTVEDKKCGIDFKAHMATKPDDRSLYLMVDEFIKKSARMCTMSKLERESRMSDLFNKDIIALSVFINKAINIATLLQQCNRI